MTQDRARRRKEGLQENDLRDIHVDSADLPIARANVTGDGSFGDGIGAWAAVLRLFRLVQGPQVEIIRGRVEAGATSTKMEILAVDQGIRRLPDPLPPGIEVLIRTDLIIIVERIQRALQVSPRQWKEETRTFQDWAEFKSLGQAVRRLARGGAEIEVFLVTKENQPPDHKAAHKFSKELLGEKGRRIIDREARERTIHSDGFDV